PSGFTTKIAKIDTYDGELEEAFPPMSVTVLIEDDYEIDKQNVIRYYNTIGFRDATILGDSIWRDEKGRVNLKIALSEGNRYYFRNITWKGNSIYDTETLAKVLGIEKGEVFNQELLDTRLSYSEEGRDVSTLYMDNGYLFFNVDPVEVAIVGDSIDLEIRIFEGPQATIDNVVIKGNDRTHEHVVRRELRTRPGDKFSRSDIIRSQREIINLGYFNPEALGINTPVNPQRGTVDIEYTVEEKPSDQLELSAGWGGVGRGVIGTLGVSFNNFSVRNIFKKETWSPLPQGDGQRLSIRAQTNGRFFQSYNTSFTEPWLGGKKPTSLTIAAFYTNLTNGADRENSNFQRFGIAGASASVGTRLKWPDDNFILSGALEYQQLSLQDWQR
ncbi:MAG: POTRA domain-containing protein, partial [Bacteroidota bacterium]